MRNHPPSHPLGTGQRPGSLLLTAAITALTALLVSTGCTTSPPPRSTKAPPPARLASKPLPIRPINIKAECEFSDEDEGYHVQAKFDIANSQVRALHTTFTVPEHGSCTLDLAQLKQTKQRPQIELRSQNDCKVMIWEQENQITVALDQCATYCTNDTFDYIWPIIVEKQTGTCH